MFEQSTIFEAKAVGFNHHGKKRMNLICMIHFVDFFCRNLITAIKRIATQKSWWYQKYF